ncbi:MAG: cupin domain-containing protein [Marinobacterium sp.]|nr:cupin domain-containing protein [Marinobacterium sp.]
MSDHPAIENRIFGDISVEQFLAEYWQKKPLLIRGAFANFEFPVDADELAGLACEEDVESRLIIHSDDGEQFDLQHGPLNESVFPSLPARCWTLLVQAVDHWVPQAGELMQQFNFIPNWRLDDLMISYAADGGGVGPHYDNYDVFLIQAAGTRRWEIGGLFDENSPRKPDLPVMILPDWQAEQSWELEPGDLLYLPPQVGHNGIAVGDGCMTYSVGFRAPAHTELFNSFSRRLADELLSEVRFADPDLSLQANPGQITTEALQQVQQLMQNYLADPQRLSQWFGEYMTEPKYPELSQPAIDEPLNLDLLDEIEGVYRTEGARLAWCQIDSSDQHYLFADGNTLPFSAAELPLVEAICSEYAFGLPEDLTDSERELLGELIQTGVLYTDEGEEEA